MSWAILGVRETRRTKGKWRALGIVKLQRSACWTSGTQACFKYLGLSHTRAHTRQLRKKAHHPRRKQTRFSRTAQQAHKTTLPEENQVPECHGGLCTVQRHSRAQPMRDLVLAQYSNNLAVTRRYVKKPRSLSALDALWMSSSLYLHIVVSLTV